MIYTSSAENCQDHPAEPLLEAQHSNLGIREYHSELQRLHAGRSTAHRTDSRKDILSTNTRLHKTRTTLV